MCANRCDPIRAIRVCTLDPGPKLAADNAGVPTKRAQIPPLLYLTSGHSRSFLFTLVCSWLLAPDRGLRSVFRSPGPTTGTPLVTIHEELLHSASSAGSQQHGSADMDAVPLSLSAPLSHTLSHGNHGPTRRVLEFDAHDDTSGLDDTAKQLHDDLGGLAMHGYACAPPSPVSGPSTHIAAPSSSPTLQRASAQGTVLQGPGGMHAGVLVSTPVGKRTPSAAAPASAPLALDSPLQHERTPRQTDGKSGLGGTSGGAAQLLSPSRSPLTSVSLAEFLRVTGLQEELDAVVMGGPTLKNGDADPRPKVRPHKAAPTQSCAHSLNFHISLQWMESGPTVLGRLCCALP